MLLIVLGLAALLNLALALMLIARPDELRYGEALVYDQAARVLRGEPLYQHLDAPPYTIVTYTPLYYWLIAALRALAGPGFMSGRVLSLLTGLISGVLVSWLAWQRSRAVWPAIAAGLLFAGLGLVGPLPWTAVAKPDVPVLGLSLASVALLASGSASRRTAIGAGALAAAAVLCKQSAIGPAIAGVVWLSACQPRRLTWFVGTGVLLSVACGLGLELSTGAFVENMIATLRRTFDARALVSNLAVLGLFQAVPVSIALALRTPLPLVKDLVLLNWLGALAPLVGFGAVGSDYNYWQPLAAFTAVITASAMWEHRTSSAGRLATALLGVSGLAGVIAVGGAAWASAYLYQVPGRPSVPGLAVAVAEVAPLQGDVLADPLDVIVALDRRILLDPLAYHELEAAGVWDPTPLVKRICAGEVGVVALGYRLEDAHADARWPARVLEAVRAQVIEERQLPSGFRPWYVYRLAPSRAGAATPTSPGSSPAMGATSAAAAVAAVASPLAGASMTPAPSVGATSVAPPASVATDSVARSRRPPCA